MRIDKYKFAKEMAAKLMSSGELASRADVSNTTIAKCLQGQNFFPITVGKIAKGLGVPVSAITVDAAATVEK